MSKFNECVDTYKKEMTTTLGLNDYDEDLLVNVAKSLGPSIYNNDSSKVSSTDPKEIALVKNNFLIGKLGLDDGPELDSAIDDVVNTMGTSNRNKYRAIFYYLLAKKFNKEDLFS